MKTSSVDKLILELVESGCKHYTSQEIYEELRKSLPAINRSTVYRSLDRLVFAGQVSVADIGTGSVVYEMVGEVNHHHLICQNCQKIITIANDDVEDFFRNIEKTSNYKIITNHLILYGICDDCGKPLRL